MPTSKNRHALKAYAPISSMGKNISLYLPGERASSCAAQAYALLKPLRWLFSSVIYCHSKTYFQCNLIPKAVFLIQCSRFSVPIRGCEPQYNHLSSILELGHFKNRQIKTLLKWKLWNIQCSQCFCKLPNMSALRQDRTEKGLWYCRWYSHSCHYFTVKSE